MSADPKVHIMVDAYGKAIGRALRLGPGEVLAIAFTEGGWDRPDRRLGTFRKRRLAERAVRQAAGAGRDEHRGTTPCNP